jgi:hypothetical protein
MSEGLTLEQQAWLEAAASMDLEDVYAQLGKLVYRGARLPPPEQLAEVARRWIADRWEDLREAVCPHRHEIINTSDLAAVAAALTPYVSHIAAGLSGVLLATTLAKMGATKLCEERKQS